MKERNKATDNDKYAEHKEVNGVQTGMWLVHYSVCYPWSGHGMHAHITMHVDNFTRGYNAYICE